MGRPQDYHEILRLLEESVAAGVRPMLGNLAPLVDIDTGDVIVDCGLLEKDIDGRLEVEVIYVLAGTLRGKGIVTEITRALVGYAFDTLNLSRVVAFIDPDNAAPARVAEKAGLHHDRHTVRPGGKLCTYTNQTVPPVRRIDQRCSHGRGPGGAESCAPTKPYRTLR